LRWTTVSIKFSFLSALSYNDIFCFSYRLQSNKGIKKERKKEGGKTISTAIMAAYRRP